MRKTQYKGKTPLHDAVIKGNKELAKLLVSRDPEVAYYNNKNGRNHEGNYPIHLACKNDSVDVVKEFLKITPFPKEFLNKKGQNILHVAADGNGNGNVVRYILRQEKTLVEPLLNEMDEDGNHLCIGNKSWSFVAAFVLVRDKRVDSSIVNNENLTPYDIAEKTIQNSCRAI
ncbi:hypothetical protein POTOM_060440 [Populus tomentosa]|uniref:Ankyrin repeat family protein n=1 Tax=Populus tomentosa TaxID=118781 RepID=A0A8X8C1Y2_POPTO|nr:hypothetical protein POTOM_060440 [Populus tomentosa]